SLDADGNVSIGTFTTGHFSRDNLVISEDNASVGLSLLSATGGTTILGLGDDVNNLAAAIVYTVSLNRMLFRINGNQIAMQLNSDLSVQAEHDMKVLENLTVGGDLGLSASGVNTIWSTFLSVKDQIYPGNTAPAAASTLIVFANSRTEWYTMQFDKDVVERAQCVPVVLPPDYDGRALTVEVWWTGRVSAVPGDTVKWRIDTMAHGDGDDLGLTTGQTNVILTDTFQGTADELHRISGTVTPGNRGADDDAISFQIRRVVSDTYTHDAHLIGLRISY
ncbi:hypothetical protein LCGC14_2320920, partial [marine sediment metagenome]